MLLLPWKLVERYPALGRLAHWVSATVSFLLVAPNEEIAQMMTFLPGSITTHRWVGFGMALLTFTRFLAAGAKRVADPAAPSVPASEAVTKLEKVDPEKSK